MRRLIDAGAAVTGKVDPVRLTALLEQYRNVGVSHIVCADIRASYYADTEDRWADSASVLTALMLRLTCAGRVMNAWSVESSEVAIQTCQNYKDAGVVLRCTLGLHPTPSQTHGAPMCPDIKKMGKPLKRIRTFLASNKEVVKGIGNCGLHYMPTVEELFPQRLPDKSQDPRGWLKLKLSKSRYSQRFITNTQHQLTFIKRQVRIAEVAKLPITLRVKDDLDQLRPTYVKFPDIRKLLHFTPNTNMRFMKRLISLPNSYLGLPSTHNFS